MKHWPWEEVNVIWRVEKWVLAAGSYVGMSSVASLVMNRSNIIAILLNKLHILIFGHLFLFLIARCIWENVVLGRLHIESAVEPGYDDFGLYGTSLKSQIFCGTN